MKNLTKIMIVGIMALMLTMMFASVAQAAPIDIPSPTIPELDIDWDDIFGKPGPIDEVETPPADRTPGDPAPDEPTYEPEGDPETPTTTNPQTTTGQDVPNKTTARFTG